MRWAIWLLLFFTLFAVFKSANVGVFAADVEDEELPVNEEEETPHADAGSDGAGNAAEEEEIEEEEIALVASPNAHTRVLFPDYPTKKIPVGKEVSVLVGFSNSGDKTFNITAIGAHLHSPYDFSYYIQNFTAYEVEGVVAPGEQVSLEYTFKPDPSLEPLEFHLSGWIVYNDSENNMFRSTFVNGTIELTEAQSDFDIRGVFTWCLAVAALGLIVYVGFNVFATPEQKKSVAKRAGAAVERGPKKMASEDSGFLEGLYTPSKQSSAVGARKSTKKAKSSKKDDS
jgi:translocon-associated protein subunit alpha